jgi:hypothetical protein
VAFNRRKAHDLCPAELAHDAMPGLQKMRGSAKTASNRPRYKINLCSYTPRRLQKRRGSKLINAYTRLEHEPH